jgi:hypothetical protein
MIVRKVATITMWCACFPTATKSPSSMIPARGPTGFIPVRLRPQIEAFDDDVMRRLQQYHPIRVA